MIKNPGADSFLRPDMGKKEREKEGFIMRKWKRSLSMLLTIAMLAGNYEPFVLSAYAATESNAIADGIINDGTSVITREDDGTTVITSDALNSDADEGEPEDDNDGSGSGDDASGDDADTSDDDDANGNGAGNNGSDNGDGNTTGDNGSNNGNTTGDNGNNTNGNTNSSASDNDADDDTHNDDTDLPDDDIDDTVSDNTSDDDSVSDNSVSDNTVSENSVSENMITEEAMNNTNIVIKIYVLDDANHESSIDGAESFEKAAEKTAAYRSEHSDAKIRWRFFDEVSCGSHSDSHMATLTVATSGTGASAVSDSSYLEVDLNDHTLSVQGTLITYGAKIYGGKILLDGTLTVKNAPDGSGHSEGLVIDELTAKGQSTIYVGGEIGANEATVARIGSVQGTEVNNVSYYPSLKVSYNGRFECMSDAGFTTVTLESKENNPAELLVRGNLEPETIMAGDYALISMDFRLDENGERVKTEYGNDEYGNIKLQTLTLGKNVLIKGMGYIDAKTLVINKNVLTVGTPEQEGTTYLGAKYVTGTTGGIVANHAYVEFVKINAESTAIAVTGDDADIIFRGQIGGSSASFTIGDDEVDANGDPVHHLRFDICAVSNSDVKIKSLEICRSAEVLISSDHSFSCSTVTVHGGEKRVDDSNGFHYEAAGGRLKTTNEAISIGTLTLQQGAGFEIGDINYAKEEVNGEYRIKTDDNGVPYYYETDFDTNMGSLVSWGSDGDHSQGYFYGAATITTLNMSPNAEIHIQPESTLTCSSTANLSSDSRIFVRGAANFKNITLKKAGGRDDLCVDFVTDDLQNKPGTIKIDGTITSDRWTDDGGNTQQGVIFLKHPKWFDKEDWYKDIAGFEAGAVLLYSKNNNNAGFFRAFFGTEASGYSEQGTEYNPHKDGNNYYKLLLHAVTLYTTAWDDEVDRYTLSKYAELPEDKYQEFKDFATVEALFAWLAETDESGNAKNLDAEGKTIYRVILEDPFASDAALTIGKSLNGIIIEGASADAQIPVSLPSFTSETAVMFCNVELNTEEMRVDSYREYYSKTDLVLSGTTIRAEKVYSKAVYVSGSPERASEIHADTFVSAEEGKKLSFIIEEGAELQCSVKDALTGCASVSVHGTLGIHGHSNETTTAELGRLRVFPGGKLEVENFRSLSISVGDDEMFRSDPLVKLADHPGAFLFLHGIGEGGITAGDIMLNYGMTLHVMDAALNVKQESKITVDPGSELILECAPVTISNGSLTISFAGGKIDPINGLDEEEMQIAEALYSQPAKVAADEGSPISITSDESDQVSLELYPDARLDVLGGLSVTGSTKLWDNAELVTDGQVSLGDLQLTASKVNPPENGYCAESPKIYTAMGTSLNVDGEISLYQQDKDSNVTAMGRNGDGRYAMPMQILCCDYTYAADGLQIAPKDFAANEEILQLHVTGTTADAMNTEFLTNGIIVVDSVDGTDAGNYRFREAGEDTYVLRVVAIQVYSMPAATPQYSAMWDNGTPLGEFATYDEAVSYIASVANASQKYYVFLPIDAKVVGTDLAIPAGGAQIVICGDPKATTPTTLDAGNVRTAVKLTNHLMFQDITVEFADGTAIDLNGKTLNICDADLTGLSDIKGKGDLVLFTENLVLSDPSDPESALVDEKHFSQAGFRAFSVANGISATNLTVTNYNIILNGGCFAGGGKLTVTGDVRVYNGSVSGIGNGSKISGNLYLDQADCRIGAAAYTAGTPAKVTFEVGKDVILRSGGIVNGDGNSAVQAMKDYNALTSFTAGGSVYLYHATIALNGDITIKKNLYTGTGDNEILYGNAAAGKFTISGTTSDFVVSDGVSRNAKNEEQHELYHTVNWDWTKTVTAVPSVKEIEPAALCVNGDGSGKFVAHANAVNVRRLYLEHGRGENGDVWSEDNENDGTAIAGIYTEANYDSKGNRVENGGSVYAGAIVVTKSDPLYFRVGGVYKNAWIRGTDSDPVPASVCGLKTSGGNLVLDLTPGAAVILYSVEAVPASNESRNVAIGGYATLQEAFNVIKAKNNAKASYVIEVRDGKAATATTVTDGEGHETLTAADWTIPDKAALITIRAAQSPTNKELYFKSKLTLNTNVTLEKVTPIATGEEVNGKWHGAVSIDLKGFTLTLDDCDLNAFYHGDKDPSTTLTKDSAEKVYFQSITGNGEAKTSALFIQNYNAEPLWVYGSVSKVGMIGFENTGFYVTGSMSVGNVNATDDIYSELCVRAMVTEDAESGYIIVPGLTVSGTVSEAGTGNLYLTQMTAEIDEEGHTVYRKLSDEVKDYIAFAIKAFAVPVMKNGMISGNVCYAIANISLNTQPAALKGKNATEPGIFVRSTIGKEKYLCYTVNSSVPYTLSAGNGPVIIGATDWATIVNEINTINDKNADYVVTLKDKDCEGGYDRYDGIINTQAETLTMPKSTALHSLKITTGNREDYIEKATIYEDTTIPAWNYIGDTITLTCDTTFENVRLVGYKTAAISEENRLTLTNMKQKKPTLTVKIGGAYTMEIAGNMIIDSRQLFLDGGSKGTLSVAGDGYFRTTTDSSDCEFSDQPQYSVSVSGKFTKLAELKLNGGVMMLSAYVTTAYKDAAELAQAKSTAPELDVAVLSMDQSEWLWSTGKITVTNLSVSKGATLHATTLTAVNLSLSDGSLVIADALTVKTKLTALAHSTDNSEDDTIEVSGACSIKDMDVYSDCLLLKTSYKSATASNLTISGTVNTSADNEVRVAVGGPDGDFENDKIAAGEPKLALVTTANGTADQFVAAKRKVVTNNGSTEVTYPESVYNCAGEGSGYWSFKLGNVIYAYQADQIEVAVLAVPEIDIAAGELPQRSTYFGAYGEPLSDLVLGYYPSYTDAVAAIDARKDAAQGYAIVLLKDVTLPDGKGIATPKNAAYVHICGTSTYCLKFTGNSTFATNVFFESIRLHNNAITTGKGNIGGYSFSVNGNYVLSLDDVATNTSTEILSGHTIKNRPKNCTIAQISNPKGSVLLSDSSSFYLSGALTANDLSLIAKDDYTELTIYGKATVSNCLNMHSGSYYSYLILLGESSLNNIKSDGDQDRSMIQFARLKGDKPSLTVSGRLTGRRVEFTLLPEYIAAWDKDPEYLSEEDKNGYRYLLPYTDGVTQALPENRLLFKAPNLDMNEFAYTEGDLRTFSLYKANGGYYASDDTRFENYAVMYNNTKYLDLNQAIQKINEKPNINGTPTLTTVSGIVTDTNRTDRDACSALPAPKANASAGVIYTGPASGLKLYFSGSPTFYGGGEPVNSVGRIEFNNVTLCPSESKFDSDGNPVPAKDGTVTFKLQRNSRSKGSANLSFNNSRIEGTVIKAITGVKGVTRLTLVPADNQQGQLVVTDGITDFDFVQLNNYTVITNKVSGIGELRFASNSNSRFVLTGTGNIDGIKVGGFCTATLCAAYTEKGSGSRLTRTPNLTVNGAITCSGTDKLIVEPLRPSYKNDSGRAVAISPVNYEANSAAYTVTIDEAVEDLTDAKRFAPLIDLPLIIAKQANPQNVTVDWNGSESGLGSAPNGVEAYRDLNGYILMTKTSDMPITLLGTDGQNQQVFSTKVRTWEDAVKIIDNRASAETHYTVRFSSGAEGGSDYGMGKNGTVSAMLWPKAANTAGLILDGGASTRLNYTGALNPTCNVCFAGVMLNEYKNATDLNPANSINASSAVEIRFRYTKNQRSSEKLRFEKITAKKGTITTDHTELTVNGAVDVGTLNMIGNDLSVNGAFKAETLHLTDGNLSAKGTITVGTMNLTEDTNGVVEVSNYDATKPSEIKVTDVTVSGGAQLHSLGKITLGTVHGVRGRISYTDNKPEEGVCGTNWKDSIEISAAFSATKPANSVSQLTITGRVYGINVEVDPYFYDSEKGEYAESTPTLRELRERGMVYTGDPAKAPAKGIQILNAPYLKLTDLTVETTDEKGGGRSILLDGYGFADGFTPDADHPGEWLTWYAGNIYVTDLPAVVDVLDQWVFLGNLMEDTTRTTNWDQAVGYVDKVALADHYYTMSLREDIGVSSWRPVTEEHGMTIGYEPAAVAKTISLPKTKTAGQIQITTADGLETRRMYFSSASLTLNGTLGINGVDLFSLKSTKNGWNEQELSLNVAAGGNVTLSCVGGSTIRDIIGTATSELWLMGDGDHSINISGGIRNFKALALADEDVHVAGDVSVTDLTLHGVGLHAANITVNGKLTMAAGTDNRAGSMVLRVSTLAADASEAVGKGAVNLKDVASFAPTDPDDIPDGCFSGNNIVSKLNAKGQTQLTIRGTVNCYDFDSFMDADPVPTGGPAVCLSYLYGRGNMTYAVLMPEQALVNGTGTAQCEALLDRVCLGYASSDPDEWRGNAGKVSGISNPVLTVPAKGKTVNVTAGH